MSAATRTRTQRLSALIVILIVFVILLWNRMSMGDEELSTQSQKWRWSSAHTAARDHYGAPAYPARYKPIAPTLQAPVSSPSAATYETPRAAQQHVYAQDPLYGAGSINTAHHYGSVYHPHIPPMGFAQQPPISAPAFQWGLNPNPMYTWQGVPPGAPGMLPVNPNYAAGVMPMGRTSLPPAQALVQHHPRPERSGPPLLPTRGATCWVGNIPPHARIEALKEHFSQGATDDIISVFLIRRSNCAFVNYLSEKACDDAVDRFGGKHLGGPNGPRLLCRRKRSETEEKLEQRKDSRTASVPQDEVHGIASLSINGATADVSEDSKAPEAVKVQESKGQVVKVKEKFFILKSLTEQDLLNSTRKGSWITQPHVQEKLHEAYCSAESVYLVFSVNKSREYYGYAKMETSPFDDIVVPEPADEPTKGVEFVSTLATEHAPPGRIVADPARDTLFWEAVREDTTKSKDSSAGNRDIPHAFKVEWLQRRRVPFQRVRGMKNPYNEHKEVKVARDGTEIEPEVAKKVIEMFDQVLEEGPSGYGRNMHSSAPFI